MIFNIPQFIDIEDKIVGPLTAKQLGWLAAGAVCALVAWTFLDLSAFIIASVLIAVVFGSLAFFRPHGQPLIFMIGSVFVFFFRPKLYIWKRSPEKRKNSPVKKSTNQSQSVSINKTITNQEIEKISNLLEIRKK